MYNILCNLCCMMKQFYDIFFSIFLQSSIQRILVGIIILRLKTISVQFSECDLNKLYLGPTLVLSNSMRHSL